MPCAAPISPHLDLYRYWNAKRGTRAEPARRDIDPAEIGRLLCHIALIEPSPEGYRWRLMGTAIAADIGRDLTGQTFGGHLGPASFVESLTANLDRVLDLRRPIFEEIAYQTSGGGCQEVSRLLLPLGGGDRAAGMVLLTRLARRSQVREEDRNRLDGATGAVRSVLMVCSLEELDVCTRSWSEQKTPLQTPPVGQTTIRIANLWSRSSVPYAIEA